MPAALRRIMRDDLLDLPAYEKVRAERRKDLVAAKKNRRMPVGPHATFFFENYETMWWQVQEMLRIEKGGDAQIPDELSAYNPLIPQGDELVATVMFEIDDPVRRAGILGRIGGVEETMFLEVAGERVASVPEQDVDRTSAAGKASSVQFVHFRLSPAQIAQFRIPGTRVVVGIDHPAYAHMAVMPEPVRAALANDFA